MHMLALRFLRWSMLNVIGSGCGGDHLYLFWDRDCGGGGHHAAWILTPKEPDVDRQSNLIKGREGDCHNWANWDSEAESLAGTKAQWGSWDGCCTKEVGSYYQVTIVGTDDQINISGLCDVEGAKQINQGYRRMGTTYHGRPYYISGTKITSFEGEDDGMAGVGLWIVIGCLLIVACVVGVCFCLYSRHLQSKQQEAVRAQQGLQHQVIGQSYSARFINVRCPDDVNPGDQVQVQDPQNGQSLHVVVPAGVSPGNMFSVQVPATLVQMPATTVAAPGTVVGVPLNDSTMNEKPITGQPVRG